MKLSRRDFLKVSGVATGTLLLPREVGRRPLPLERFPLRKRIGEGHTICPYCSVGCGLLIATDETGHITNSEGDPDHIISRGALDPKSICVRQLNTSPDRAGKVLYRAPYSSEWEEKEWDWAFKEIAKRIKKVRDETFEEKDANGVAVNRTEALAFFGGAANNDEDCYLAVKLMRALGLVAIEHQARI